VATLDLKTYPGGTDFLKAYADKYGESNPDPYAIYGYEAMKLALDTIADAGTTDKATVLDTLFNTKDRNSVLGSYGFDENGDTTLTSYGLYKVDSSGNPVFFKKLTPPSDVTSG
jgi:branched-chain amino acid transport system substrate-binding protein